MNGTRGSARNRLLLLVAALAVAAGCSRVGGTPDRGLPSHYPPRSEWVEPGEPLGEVEEGWTQEGVASWYGEAYHGNTTASGEVFDMYAPTAAHRRLPFGTLVRVRNLENGAETVVRINDRGPFIQGRVVDLSRHGAEELGIVHAGTAEVRLIVVEPP